MLNPGAVELNRYLKKNRISATSFAARHGLARVHLHKVLNGQAGGRVTADFAYVIQRATNGAIAMDRWVSAELRKDRRAVAA